MDTALDVFRLMMREEIAPELRRMGFKGSGQSFILPSEAHWVLLGFQKARASYAEYVRFTVNVTAVSKRAWVEARSERSYLSERPNPKQQLRPLGVAMANRASTPGQAGQVVDDRYSCVSRIGQD